MKTRFSTSLFAMLLAIGCGSSSSVTPDAPGPSGCVAELCISDSRDIDILFVIDNSLTMTAEQVSLGNNFQRFVNVLETVDGGRPNIHLGVISSDVGVGGNNVGGCAGAGDNGILQNIGRVGACTPPNGRYISDVEDPNGGGRITNYTGTLAETFNCVARLGETGCGFEQHFESMRRALDGSNPENAGFLRANAYLAVIFVADEDDCSANDARVFDATQTTLNDPLGPLSSFRCFEFGVTCDGSMITRTAAAYTSCEPQLNSMYIHHPSFYVDFLKSLKANPNDIIVAGIVGYPTPFSVTTDAMTGYPSVSPSCATPAGAASPGVRFSWLLDQFPNRNRFTSICNTDLSDALIVVAELLVATIGTACLPGNIDQLDLFPNEPGLQLDCQVVDIVNPSQPNQTETPLAPCQMLDANTPSLTTSTLPCWWTVQDFAECSGTPSNLLLNIERNVDPPSGTVTSVTCTQL